MVVQRANERGICEVECVRGFEILCPRQPTTRVLGAIRTARKDDLRLAPLVLGLEPLGANQGDDRFDQPVDNRDAARLGARWATGYLASTLRPLGAPRR